MDQINERDAILGPLREASLKGFRSFQKLLRKVLAERAVIDQKIIIVQRDLANLAPLCGILESQHPLAEMGLTDAVRNIVGAATEKGVATPGVRKILALCGVRLPESNPLAAVQTALKRLESKGEIEKREGR